MMTLMHNGEWFCGLTKLSPCFSGLIVVHFNQQQETRSSLEAQRTHHGPEYVRNR